MIKKRKNILFSSFYNIFGLGKPTINRLYLKTGLNIKTSPKKCKTKQHFKIILNLKKKILGKSLKNKIKKSILFQAKTIQTFRGIRLFLKYPVRGQRTHTNAKTAKKFKLIA
jgi:small subunit ribosomal protein S13